MESLVSTEWLARHLGEQHLVVVDSTAFLPGSGRDARSEYRSAHIPGARFLDIAEVADSSSSLPHMLPSGSDFAGAMEKLGIGSEDSIVVYDNSPLRTAARGWFMFRHFGAQNVAVLDGGFQKWSAEGRPVESGDSGTHTATFHSVENAGEVVTKEQILGGTGCALVDARGKPRFEGSEPEPRPGMASGHIPGARNIPYSSLYEEDGTFKSTEEVRRIFEDAGASPDEPFVASCGSGVTACSLLFAAHLLGNDETRLYDGSWSEWGADPETPKATGPA